MFYTLLTMWINGKVSNSHTHGIVALDFLGAYNSFGVQVNLLKADDL